MRKDLQSTYKVKIKYNNSNRLYSKYQRAGIGCEKDFI